MLHRDKRSRWDAPVGSCHGSCGGGGAGGGRSSTQVRASSRRVQPGPATATPLIAAPITGSMRTAAQAAAAAAAPPAAAAAAGGAAAAAAAARRPAFRLALVLDITGSMGSQLEGVKAAAGQLVQLAAALPGLDLCFAVVTYTETHKACYVSLERFEGEAAAAAAHDYIAGLRLCRPPEAPDVEASGDDGPENLKAALVRLTELEPAPATIAFVITDAPPHLRRHGRGSEAAAELAWLAERGVPAEVAADAFKTLGLVVAHFGGSLVLNAVAYSDGEALGTLGALAAATGGLLLKPASRQSAVLARGMLAVVRSLAARLHPAAAAAAGADAEEDEAALLGGFQLLDAAAAPPPASEEEPFGPPPAAGDAGELFACAMARMCQVCGAKWSKRALGMSAPREQLQFVWRAARLLAAGAGCLPPLGCPALEAELAALGALRAAILDALPPESRGHFSLGEEDLRALAAAAARLGPAAGGDGGGAATSCISLATVGDALGEEADWEDWLASVARLLQGWPARLALPLDREGRPDFMDAWSASVQEVGVDRLTAGEFLALAGDRPAARGPTDGQQHNAFVAAVAPGDALAALVFRVTSGTQVLNYVTGVALGAKGFLPHLHAGAAASILADLLQRSPLPAFRREQAEGLALTPPLPWLGSGSEGADADAAAAAARQRLLCGAGLVLEEWLAALYQRFYGKRGPESDAQHLASVAEYLPLAALLPGEPEEVDPLARLHPLEESDAELAPRLAPGWLAAAAERLRRGDAAWRLPPHPSVQRFEAAAGHLMELLLLGEGSGGEALLAAAWPAWQEGLVACLLQRARTARYELAPAGSGEEGEREWRRLDAPVAPLCLGRLREVAAQQLAGYRRARAAAAEERLLAVAAEAVRAAAPGGEAAVSEALERLFLPLGPGAGSGAERPAAAPRGPLATLLGQSVCLGRGAVPALLERLGAGAPSPPPAVPPAVLRALVAGAWTTQPPQALRCSAPVRAALAAAGQPCADVLDALSARALCCRAAGANANRHGHTAERQYPGADGWSEEYAAARLAAVRARLEAARASRGRTKRALTGHTKYLEAMRRFAAVAAWARGVAAGEGAEVEAGVEAALAQWNDDANRVESARAALEALLGRRMAP